MSTFASILMPAYNAEEYIGQAIESVLAQHFKRWELIIVNDGSQDRTPEIAASYTDSRIRVFHQENGGESSARNTALKHAEGKWIAFLDADDEYLPNHLEDTIGYLETHPEYGGIYSDGYYCDEYGKRLKTLSSRRRGPFEGDIFEQVIRSSDVFGAPVCVVIRRDLIIDHKLEFDPSIVIGPDWDFLTRYSEVAYFGYADQITCLYRVHKTNISICTDAQKRNLSLAKCREKAVKLERFNTCSIDTRAFVFYDLLINLLTGSPERQKAITQWPEFNELPAYIQAQLFRLLASKAIETDINAASIPEWLHNSRILNPKDKRTVLLYGLYKFNPRFCQNIMRIRHSYQQKRVNNSPFSDLFQ
jgi:glycosyltransferase involved in cell wall biosynthesis